ncbi:hypothetical protein [Peribacillus sp. TH14]|uniref:hypothetical protein n=1 Tax=Peribacillus sp. TH14 TaxID=2798481 RepID=UPI001912D448|nr:hypothetical protein [Peribacillus sp. TH14]MBK5497401.1 hypothetical protein [Peribacillus sp. TH14]
MDKTALVEKDFNDGRILIKQLDRQEINVHSALWLYNPDEENWRLIIASRIAEFTSPKRAYNLVKKALRILENTQGEFGITLDNISVVSPNHPLIKLLAVVIVTEPDALTGFRLSRNRINNSFIEDAYIYRLQS